MQDLQQQNQVRRAQAVRWSPFSPKELVAVAFENGDVTIEELEADLQLQQQFLAKKKKERAT